jgi:DNA-binding winged helix-turn-helix (wHTH) protein/TolB-like protein/tetratricopeptide (TPR) repeat protein
MSTVQGPWADAGFLLADWEVRPRYGTLLRRSDPTATPVQLEPRVMAVLVCLAKHAGEVVTRDEFIADVWESRVVSDEALSRCISLLRQALQDDSREPRFIRTVAKVGYALLQPPAPLGAVGPPLALPVPRSDEVRGAGQPRSGRVRRGVIAALAAVGLLAGITAFLALRETHPDALAPPPPMTRLLVLPFDVHEAREVDRDVGNELADEIADSLARVSGLRVSGRTSAGVLAASHATAVDAGRKLGVDAVLDGAVAGSAQGLRVTVRLTSTGNGRLLWSSVYERKAEDIFAVQSSIASAVVRELLGRASREGLVGVRSVEPESRDLEAYRLYLRGAHQLQLRGEDSLRLAIDRFSAALRRDPSYARAQVGLASAYVLLPSYTFEDPEEMYALAEAALDAADRLTGTRSLSAGTRAYLCFIRRRWLDAETAFRTAIAADPNNPEVRQQYSQLLGAMGRLDAALDQIHLAQDIDPLAPVVADRMGILHLWLGRDAEAASDVALARELGLEEAAYPETKIILELHQHADEAAADALRSLQHAVNRSDAWIVPTLDAYRHPEKRPAAIEMLDRARDAGALSARLYFGAMVLLGSSARALRAVSVRNYRDANDLEFLFSVDAVGIRGDPVFGEFVRAMGLEAYWDRFGWPGACRREGGRVACH